MSLSLEKHNSDIRDHLKSRSVDVTHPNGMELGRGSFGIVKGVGSDAVKSFNGDERSGLNYLVNEAFVTRFVSLSKSPNIIQLKKCDFENLTMTTQRWHCSLDVAIKRGLSRVQKKAIHLCILRGLAHLGRCYIINADIKPSNILVDAKYMNACIADFGISSSSGAAKVRQTSQAFSLPRSKVKNHRSHDSFSFVVLTLHLLYGYAITKVIQDTSELRYLVISSVPSGTMRNTLLNLVQENRLECWTAERALYELYGERLPHLERRVTICDLTNRELLEIIEGNITRLMRSFYFRRYNRCFRCSSSICSYLGLTSNQSVLQYSTVMAYIFSCVFGTRKHVDSDKKFSGVDAMSLGDITHNQFMICLNTIISDSGLIKLMFAP